MADEIGGVDVRRQVVMLGRESDSGTHVDPRCRGIVPEHDSSPASRVRRPSTSEMNVVLPAPFGPSSPVMPWPMSTSSPSTASVER